MVAFDPLHDPACARRSGDQPRRITVMRIMDRLNVGGPAIHAVLTSKGLDPQTFETILVIGEVGKDEGDMSYLLRHPDMPEVVCIPHMGRELGLRKDIVTLARLMRLMQQRKPDVVHTHKAKAGALGRLAAILMGVPVRVHTYHGHVLSGYFGPWKSRLFCAIERALARYSSALITPSDAVADELAQSFAIASREKFTVVPLGFDLAPFLRCKTEHKGKLRAELGVDPHLKLVGIVGRMVPIKDHATFVAAAALLSHVAPNTHFVFVGGGELEADLRALCAQVGLSDRTHFLGWRKDMAPILADLDVLALSSLNEGTPVAIIEALAAAVPVAATRVGGVPDVLADGAHGELAPPQNPQALCDAIARAMLPAAQARAREVQQLAQETYGAQRLCGDLQALYLRLLASRTSPSPRKATVV